MFLVEKSNIQQEPAEKNISQILLCFKCFFSKRHPTYSKNLQKKVSHESYFVSNVLFLAQDIHIKQELMKIQANFTRSRFQSVYIQDPKCAIYLLPINFFLTSYMYPGSIKNKSRHIQDPIVNQELCFQNLYIKKRI